MRLHFDTCAVELARDEWSAASELHTSDGEYRFIQLYNLFREQEPPFKSRCRVVRRIHVCVVLGAAFWMDPGNGPSGTVVVAQLTLAKVSGAERTATLGVQGRSGPKEEDWRQDAVTWSLP